THVPNAMYDNDLAPKRINDMILEAHQRYIAIIAKAELETAGILKDIPERAYQILPNAIGRCWIFDLEFFCDPLDIPIGHQVDAELVHHLPMIFFKCSSTSSIV